jgi:hypothetical protein
MVETGGGQPGEAGFGERCTVELEERLGHRVEAEGVTLLQHDTSKLAPDFDDEGFGHGLDHGLNLLHGREMVTIRQFDNGGGCQMLPLPKQIPRVRHQYGVENLFRAGVTVNMTRQ